LIKILEALVAHVKSEGALLKTDALLAAVRDHLDRKDCSYSDMYERVRRLKERYDKTVSKGVVPKGEDELQMYNLSDAIWGEKAKEAIAAAASQNGSTVTKSKKGQINKEEVDGNSKGGTSKEVTNQNGDTRKGSKKGRAIDGKTDRDVKSKVSKEGTATGTSSKTKKRGNDNEELGKGAKSGTSKETAITTTQNGDALTKLKKGKMDIDRTPKEASTSRQNDGTRTQEETHQEETEIGATVQGTPRMMGIDRTPKEASTSRQNDGTQTQEETHQEETEIGATVQGTPRIFDGLKNQYPSLAWRVERIEAHHPCGEALKRAFESIPDEKANALESKIKKQRISEAKVQIRRADITKEVLNLLIGLVD
jgi:hypothetical protein